MNEALFQYVAESAVCLLLFYLFYTLVLQRETCLQLNRFYLLGAIVLSFALPLSNLPGIDLWSEKPVPEMEAAAPVVYEMPMVQEAYVVEAPTAEPFNYWNLLYAAYGLGVLFFAGKLLLQLLRLSRYARQQPATIYLANQVPVIFTDGQYPTFSFWRWVFFDNSQELTLQETRHILQHEEVHLNQRHTLDILLVSVIGIFFWFNPLLLLFKKALEQAHEFIADAEVAKSSDSDAYSSLLVKQVFQNSDFALGSHFFFSKSLTLTRIKMIKKLHQSPKLSRLLLLIPVMALLVTAVAAMRPVEEPEMPEANLEKGLLNYFEEAKKETIPAQFPGGREAVNQFVRNQFLFPKVAFDRLTSNEKTVQVVGSVEISIDARGAASFSRIINLEASPSHPDVTKALEKEFARVISLMPGWSPALKDGQPVASKEIINIASISSDFVSYDQYAQGRQQKTKVTSATVNGNTSLGQKDPLKEITVEGYPSSNGFSEVAPNIPELIIVFYPPAQLSRDQVVSRKNGSEAMKRAATVTSSGQRIYIAVEKMPEFPGGTTSFYKKVANSIAIPKAHQETGIEGSMVGTFVVSPEGKVTMVEILQGLSPTLDQELVRVLSNLPDFKPGMQNGKAVAVRYKVPVRIEGKFAEKKEEPETNGNSPAMYPGGKEALYHHLNTKFLTPEIVFTLEQGEKGIMFSRSIKAEVSINEKGEITNVSPQEINTSPGNSPEINKAVEKEFLRVANQLSKWIPAHANGKPIASKEIISFSTGTLFWKDSYEKINSMEKKRAERPYTPPKPDNSPKVTADGEKIFIAVEKMPQFPGGQAEMFKYFNANFKLPAGATEGGTLVGSFVVGSDGKITMIEVLKKLSPSLDNEFVRVISAMPTWQPGMQNGKAVNVKYTVPFRIKTDE